MTISNYMETRILDRVFGRTTTPLNSTLIYASLHTADPGETGTNAPLASCPRFSVHFGAAGGSTIANDTTASIVASATGGLTHVALWDSSDTATANCLWSGPLNTTKTVANTGDTVTLAVGALVVTID